MKDFFSYKMVASNISLFIAIIKVEFSFVFLYGFIEYQSKIGEHSVLDSFGKNILSLEDKVIYFGPLPGCLITCYV